MEPSSLSWEDREERLQNSCTYKNQASNVHLLLIKEVMIEPRHRTSTSPLSIICTLNKKMLLGKQGNNLKNISRLLPKFEKNTFFLPKSNSSHCAHKGWNLTWNFTCVPRNKYPRTDPWHRGQLAKNRLHQYYLPSKLCNRLITSNMPTRNGTLSTPKLSTGKNLCQYLF